MSLARYFLDIEDRVPASFMAVLERGAIVNGAQVGVNSVTVHAPHEIATSDKLLYCPTRTNVQGPPGGGRVFTCSGSTATTVTFSGATFDFPDKALLLNLGVDSGGAQNSDGSYQRIEWDAAVVPVYKDPAGATAWASSRVTIDPGGESGFWANGRIVWICAVDTGNRGLRVYPDVGSTGGAGSITRDTVAPVVGDQPAFWIKDQGTGNADILYVRFKWDDDTWDWAPIVMGQR